MSLSVAEALARVVEHAGRQPVVSAPLFKANGLVLAVPVVADLDSPPFAKPLMDGFAVRNADMATGRAELELAGELLAGGTWNESLAAGTTVQIMTGAPVPPEAEAVVIVERSRRSGGGRILLEDADFRPNQNVMPRGREFQAGQTVLLAGHPIGPAEIGLMASVGHTHPKVYRRPRIAVLPTGDEIVPPSKKPGPGQIRNSNESTILALAQRAGCEVGRLGIAHDDVEDLSSRVINGLSFDLLVLSGGVSAGKRDLVPEVLARHGVAPVFHGVNMKPGKPVWFGNHEDGLVFGLPGNPVSVLVCFELFVRTAVRARQSHPRPLPPEWPAVLKRDLHYPTKRPTYHPAKLTVGAGGYEVEPVDWYGSPDLQSLVAADALLVCAETTGTHRAGTVMKVIPI